jgi:lipoprotein-anchoring transpeptidase ErfK/SrfK
MPQVAAAVMAAGLMNMVDGGLARAAPEQWTGFVRVDSATVYDTPGGISVGTFAKDTPIAVTSWVSGPPMTPDNFTWASIGDHRFVHSSVLRHSPLSDVPEASTRTPRPEHWADADLTQQTLTLYDQDRPVRRSLMNSGRPGVDTTTHEGVWPVASRVSNETMRGDGYDVSGVLFTQYFTPDAEAIHLNYWLTDEERGIPRSHGCIGLAYADAEFAWRFLDVGAMVSVHT